MDYCKNRQAINQSPQRQHSSIRLRDELLRTGIRGKRISMFTFRLDHSRNTIFACSRWDKDSDSQRVVFLRSEHARWTTPVALAIEERKRLYQTENGLFAAFIRSEAARTSMKPTGRVYIAQAQMNPDLLTKIWRKHVRAMKASGLSSARYSSWAIKKGDEKGKWQVSVEGFDYYNTKSVRSNPRHWAFAVWLLDTYYDGRSLFRVSILPNDGEGEAVRLARLSVWDRRGFDRSISRHVSLPFESGSYKRIAVKLWMIEESRVWK